MRSASVSQPSLDLEGWSLRSWPCRQTEVSRLPDCQFRRRNINHRHKRRDKDRDRMKSSDIERQVERSRHKGGKNIYRQRKATENEKGTPSLLSMSRLRYGPRGQVQTTGNRADQAPCTHAHPTTVTSTQAHADFPTNSFQGCKGGKEQDSYGLYSPPSPHFMVASLFCVYFLCVSLALLVYFLFLPRQVRASTGQISATSASFGIS